MNDLGLIEGVLRTLVVLPGSLVTAVNSIFVVGSRPGDQYTLVQNIINLPIVF